MIALDFTPDDSKELDKTNRQLRHPERALRVDPALWEAFAEDRATAPHPTRRPPKRDRLVRPTHCLGCGYPFRPYKALVSEFPGTVKHEGKGLCPACVAKRRNGAAS